jgi:hypothetical protein
MANETTQTHESTGADGHASGGGLPQFQFVFKNLYLNPKPKPS